MEILVLGAGGMAGHLAVIYLQEQGHEVVGFSRSLLPYCECFVGDALDKEVIKKVVTNRTYDAVINCIGVLNKDVDAHVASGIYLNSYLPHFVADCLKNTNTKFIHLSTDCVFSGKHGGYSEDSMKDSSSLYGLTKSLGELNDTKNLTIRTSIIGPDRNEDGIGLMNWFYKQEGIVKGYTSAIWTGVSTITLAKALHEAIKENLSGLYHLVNNKAISKYELLQLFNIHFRNNQATILPDDSVHVNKSLINHRNDFKFIVPSYDHMVEDTNQWIEDHKEFYPHYF